MNKYEQIGKALALYSFLRYDQMIKIGLATRQSNLSPYMTDLIADKLVYKLYRVGRKAVFYLSQKGARYFGGTGRKEYEDYPAEMKHRLDTVDFHIYLSQHYLSKVERYFDKRKACRIHFVDRYVEPDLIAYLDTPKQSELILFEAERGTDFSKTVKKISPYFECIINRGVALTLNFTRAYRIVFQVKTEQIFQKILREIKHEAHYQPFVENFLFTWEEGVFCNMNGVDRRLYYV